MKQSIPTTDEEALALLSHPFTAEYQEMYQRLRTDQHLSILAALCLVLEHRGEQQQQIIDQYALKEKGNWS